MKVTKVNNCMPKIIYKKLLQEQYCNDDCITDSFYNEKKFLQSQLKNKNTLYNLYADKDAGISKEVLSDERIMNDLYKDPDFLKSSVLALKALLEEKLCDENLSKADRKALTGLYTLFSMQAYLYDNPLNSFKLEEESDETRKNIEQKTGYMPQLRYQPSFGTVFNYGFFNKPKTRKKKAEAIVNRYATLAAGESALLLNCTTPGVETAALTTTTIKMCYDICKTYEMPGGAVTSLIAQISGELAGKASANYLKNIILKFFPGAGNGVNAATTYSLHEIQGRAIIKWCEKNYKNPDVVSWDFLAKGLRLFSFFNSVTPNPVDSLGGDGLEL